MLKLSRYCPARTDCGALFSARDGGAAAGGALAPPHAHVMADPTTARRTPTNKSLSMPGGDETPEIKATDDGVSG
jgi:hypothetical protein